MRDPPKELRLKYYVNDEDVPRTFVIERAIWNWRDDLKGWATQYPVNLYLTVLRIEAGIHASSGLVWGSDEIPVHQYQGKEIIEEYNRVSNRAIKKLRQIQFHGKDQISLFNKQVGITIVLDHTGSRPKEFLHAQQAVTIVINMEPESTRRPDAQQEAIGGCDASLR